VEATTPGAGSRGDLRREARGPGPERLPAPSAPLALRTVRRMAVGLEAGAQVGRAAALGAAAGAAGLVLRRRWLRRYYLRPLRERSAALRGARVVLHAVRPEGLRPGAWDGRSAAVWTVLLTVRPRPAKRGFARWHARDLVLVAPGARAGHPEEDEEVGRVLAAEVFARGSFRPLDLASSDALAGPQRLRLRLALRPGTRRFLLRYYLELLRSTPPASPAPAGRAARQSRAESNSPSPRG
jgi:hypothetical protein